MYGLRDLIRCRRGTVAFAMLAMSIPLVGMVGLGTEVGSWYVIKTEAQNAADAAAMAGALAVATSPGSAPPAQTGTINGFTAAQVVLSQPNATQVKAVVSISVPQQLTKPFYQAPGGLIPISATAIAQVNVIANPCMLALSRPISFQGNATVNAQACGFLSNSTASNAINFTGAGTTINSTLSSAGGCSQNGSANNCKNVATYSIPVADPLSALNTVLANLTINTTNFPNGSCTTPGPVAFSAFTKCYNGTAGNGKGNKGGYSFPTTAALNGVYFFAGPVSIGSNVTITGVATLILLPGASLTITGNPSIQLTAPASIAATSVPVALNTTTLLSLMAKLLIYDPETTSGNGTVSVTGNSSSYFNGIVYAPNATVTYTGSSSTTGTGCNEVIAAGIAYSGSTSYLNNGSCPSTLTAKLTDQFVALVQ